MELYPAVKDEEYPPPARGSRRGLINGDVVDSPVLVLLFALRTILLLCKRELSMLNARSLDAGVVAAAEEDDVVERGVVLDLVPRL